MRREKTNTAMADAKRNKREGKDLGLSNLLIGILFLINPYYGVIDILPDFIGMVIIYRSIEKLADLDERLHDSKKNILAATWVSVAMFFAMGMGIFSGGMDKTTTLTIMLASHIVYCILLIPAFRNLFAALEYGDIRKNSEKVEKKDSNPGIISAVFLVVRGICAFAPWLSALGYRDEINSNSAMHIFLIAAAGVVSLVFGIIWFSNVRKYMKAFFRDREMVEYFYNRYQNEIACDKNLWFIRGISKFTIYSLVGYFFTLSIPLDGYYFMPEFLFALFMFLAFYSVKDYPGNKKRIRTSLICFGILSLLRYSAMLFYSVTYEFISSPYDGRLSSPVKFWIVYAIMAVLTAASCAFMIVLSVEHHRFRNHMIVESVGKANNESVYRDEMDEARRKELRHKSIAVLVLQIIYAVATVATTMMIPFGEVSDAFGLQWLYRMLLLAAAMIGIYAVSLSISSEAARIK